MHSDQVGNLSITYEKIGTGPLLILLHGWANTWEAWLPVLPYLADHFTLIIPDLPGFGKSQGPQNGWTTLEYAAWLHEFILFIRQRYHLHEPFSIAGHSYGGKLAAVYCSQFTPIPDKLILIDASGIPSRLSITQQILHLSSKLIPNTIKQRFTLSSRERVYQLFGAETDYIHATPWQQKTLSLILSENIEKDLDCISSPTLLIWGSRKKFPPLLHGEKFHQHIRSSILKVYDSGHFPHHEYAKDVASDMISFLKNEIQTSKQTTLSLTTRLAILQQAEYNWEEYSAWIQSHSQLSTPIKPKKWTPKLLLLKRLTKLTAPIYGIDAALYFWNQILKVLGTIIVLFMTLLAIIKLRYLQSRGLTVIAIAGSFGKTSTKYAVTHVMESIVSTHATPENINTPIGISREILNNLKRNHKVFVVELGEYYPKDIARLVRFLAPKYKILTPIGFAHLQKFKTVRNLELGLLELITTPPCTKTFVHESNKEILEKHRIPTHDLTFYGASFLKNFSMKRAGTEFDINLPIATVHVYTPLLGKHLVTNILPAILLSQEFGSDFNTVIKRIQSLKPVPHRLEPSLLSNNILVLDNGYNSNPQAAIESLEVLKNLEGSQHIVVTPGFVDMGEFQEKANENFGKQLSRIASLVVLIKNPNSSALLKGLKNGKMPINSIFEADDETQAMNVITPHIKPNAVILFENSIPEIYK